MPRIKIPYQEGTVFAVPLRDRGWGIGVVARSTKRGGTVLCYFFGPRRMEIPPLEGLGALLPEQSVLIRRVGDLGLIRRTWPVIGSLPNWQRPDWPMPAFYRTEPILGMTWKVYFSDVDPSKVEREERVPFEKGLPSAGLYGCGAAEIVLTKRLNQIATTE